MLRKQPECALLLIGDYRGKLARRLGGSPSIINTGYVQGESLNQYLAACDLLWLPLRDTLTNRGRWPMKLSDYMACGRATVSTDVGDWAQLFRGDRPIGLLAQDEPEEFARQTLSLLADEPARQTYARHARQVAATRFDWEV